MQEQGDLVVVKSDGMEAGVAMVLTVRGVMVTCRTIVPQTVLKGSEDDDDDDGGVDDDCL